MARKADINIEKECEIADLYAIGNGINPLAELFGCHSRRIQKILINQNIEIRHGCWMGHSPESREKISLTNKGKKRSAEFCERNGKINRGKKFSLETRTKISKARTGKFRAEDNPNWRGGVTPFNELIRKSNEYKDWRDKVLKRDNYTCVLCGQWGGNLNTDHIKPFSLYPELRLDLNNGRTLCADCHRQTPTYAGKLNLEVSA